MPPRRRRRRRGGRTSLHGSAAEQPPVAVETERLPVPRHRQQLEAQPRGGALPQAPDGELLRRWRRCGCGPGSEATESEASSEFGDRDREEEDEFGPDPHEHGDVEADAPHVASRFPRTLRLSGLGLGDLREALRSAGSAAEPPGLEHAAAASLVQIGEGPDEFEVRWRDPADAAKARREAEGEVLKRVAAWNRAELRFVGLFARKQLGSPAWVARYRQRMERSAPAAGRHDELAPLELEVLVLPRGPVTFELSLYWTHDVSRWCRSLVREHVSFFFNGDLDLLAISPRGQAILRAEAGTLDMLFRSPASRPQFMLRHPRLQFASVSIDFDRTNPAQATAGQIYRHFVLRGAAATMSPEVLRISCASELSGLAGTYRRVTTRGAGDGGEGRRPRGAERAARRQSREAARREAAPLRLSHLSLHTSMDVESDGFSEASSVLDDGPDSGESSAGESMDNDERDEWNLYCCPERSVLLYPAVWKWPGDDGNERAESEDEAMGRPCPESAARWVFVRYSAALLGAATGSSSSSSSSSGPAAAAPAVPTLTRPEVTQALMSPLAWVDIPGSMELQGTFQAAVPRWVPVRGAALQTVFSRDDDDELREVVVPKCPPEFERLACGREDAAPWWDVRAQVMQTSLRLNLAARSEVGHHRGRRAEPTPSDVRAALPIGHWVGLQSQSLHLETTKNCSTLHALYQELDEAFQWPRAKASPRRRARLLVLPGPEHCQRVQEVPAAISGWCAFGGHDLWPLVEELVELARERTDKHLPLAMSLLTGDRHFNPDGLPKAIQHEVCRSRGDTLELRACVKPGLLLLALLASSRVAASGRQDPGALDYCFEWRLEDKRQIPAGAAVSGAAAAAPAPRADDAAASAASAASAAAAAASGAAASGAANAPAAPRADGGGAPRAAARGGAGPGAARAAAPAADLPFTLLSNQEDPEHAQPARFRSYPLRSEQLRTLRWMRAAERSEEAFVFDHEAVDQAARLHGWRLRGRLRSAVRVRGGILADKVGYGKTATTIGLVECTRGEGAPRPPRGHGTALVPSRATLVLCPVNLITQWVREVQKFVAGGLKVIPLQTYAQLKRASAQDLADADIVLATYRLFYSAPYLERLRQLACLQSGDGRGRARAAVPRWRAAQMRRRGMMCRRVEVPLPAALRWPPQDQIRIGGRDAQRRHSLRLFSRQYAQVLSKLEGAHAPIVEVAPGGGAPCSEPAGERPAKRMRTKGPLDAAQSRRGPGAREVAPAGAAPARGAAAAGAASRGGAGARPPGGAAALGARARPPRAAARAQRATPGAEGPPLLGCFHWKRLVLDEFHELLARHPPAQVVVRSLSSKYRWGLSGTLPTKKTADVVKMAAFFNADLAGAKHRSHVPRAVCQQWLDHCVRRNTAGLQELRSEEEIVLVRQHPAERALYLQLAHAASDLDLVGEEDAAVLLSLRRRGQEGLVKLCSHFQLSGGQLQRSALDECDAVLQRRTRELASSRQAVRKALEEAWTLVLQLDPLQHLVDGLEEARRRWAELRSSFPQRSPPGAEAGSSAADGDPADETRRHFHCCLADVEAVPADSAGVPESIRQLLRRSRPPGRPAAGPPQDAYARALQAWRASKVGQAVRKEAGELHKKAVRAVASALRAMRTLEACARLVHFFDVTVRTARDVELMKCPICFEDIPLALRCVLPCAHLGCNSCIEEVVRRDARCPVCRAPATPRQVMRLEAHEGLGAPASECGRFGSKITRLLEFLAALQEREPSAKVILFVQWEDLKRKVAGALGESSLAFEELRGGVFARRHTIERFQHEEAGSRVLLLSLEDSASGTNLTRANHVILFHPVVSGTREAAVACEMQAVGRALRAGQERLVKIWRFVTAGTVEQRLTEDHQHDLWERWQRRAGQPAASGSRG